MCFCCWRHFYYKNEEKSNKKGKKNLESLGYEVFTHSIRVSVKYRPRWLDRALTTTTLINTFNTLTDNIYTLTHWYTRVEVLFTITEIKELRSWIGLLRKSFLKRIKLGEYTFHQGRHNTYKGNKITSLTFAAMISRHAVVSSNA